MHNLIFGNIDSRRAKEWEKVVGKQSCSWVSFQEVIQSRFPVLTEPTTVRITSPGESFEVFKLLVRLGGYQKTEHLVYEKGKILLHGYWYKGWAIVLDKIQDFLSANPLAKVMNDPPSIKLAFHKTHCQQVLSNAGIPIPKIYCNQLTNFQQLLESMESSNLHKVFLKPAHASSASGIMMFRKSGNKMLLETTIRMVKEGRETKLFNHLQLQKYQDPNSIQTIIEKMIPNRLHVEQWIHKKRFQSKSTDFRVVVINKQPIFVQPRHSSHPITNLHLGNEKGSILALENAWGKSVIDKVKAIAVKTAEQFSGLFYAGIDIAVDRTDHVYVLEVNAFGDFLIGIHVDQKNTYEYEYSAWKSSYNSIPIC